MILISNSKCDLPITVYIYCNLKIIKCYFNADAPIYVGCVTVEMKDSCSRTCLDTGFSLYGLRVRILFVHNVLHLFKRRNLFLFSI